MICNYNNSSVVLFFLYLSVFKWGCWLRLLWVVLDTRSWAETNRPFSFFPPLSWGASLLSFLSAVLRRKKPQEHQWFDVFMIFLHVTVVKPTVLFFFSHLSKLYYSSMAIATNLCRADCFCECIPTGVLFLFSCHLFCNLVWTQYFTSVCQSSSNKFSSSSGWVAVLKAWLLGSLRL